MRLKSLELAGFKSFAKKTKLHFDTPMTGVVGPNGSGKSNVVEAFRFVLGEQSIKSMRGGEGKDMIFKGTTTMPAKTNAKVEIVFDNHDNIFRIENSDNKVIDISTNEISISREVFADGINEYKINGLNVRLKDIQNLLSSVSIGSSGHQIISQGEADRMLSSNSKERRIMIEDSLGLKVFLTRIKDTEKKLEKSKETLKEVESQKRELKPALNSLAKQVEKINESYENKQKLSVFFSEFFFLENKNIEENEKNILIKKEELKNEIEKIKSLLLSKNITNDVFGNNKNEDFNKKIQEERIQANKIQNELNEIIKKSSYLEGSIDFLQKQLSDNGKNEKEKLQEKSVNLNQIKPFVDELKNIFVKKENFANENLIKDTISSCEKIVEKIENLFHQNLENSNIQKPNESVNENFQKVKELLKQKNEFELKILALNKIKNDKENIIRELENEIKNEEKNYREIVNKEYEDKLRLSQFENEIKKLDNDLILNKTQKENLENLAKNIVILGIRPQKVEGIVFEKNEQQNRLQEILRLQIKLEDTPPGQSEIVKEYKDLKDRFEFIEKEVFDIKNAIDSMFSLRNELKKQVDETFKSGVIKISEMFNTYLGKIFSGGEGHLSLTTKIKQEDDEQEDTIEYGIDVNISFSHKKIKDLAMLSGGERSLVSICLLFSVAELTNPPFLILDETDAALDEANSRRYGILLSELSKNSQLIVVTHNRETMSYANVLYGVTIDRDGSSKLLSIKLEEALKSAK